VKSAAKPVGGWIAKATVTKLFGKKHERKLQDIRSKAIKNAAAAQYNDKYDVHIPNLLAALERIIPSGSELAALDVGSANRAAGMAIELERAAFAIPGYETTLINASLNRAIDDCLCEFGRLLVDEAKGCDAISDTVVIEQLAVLQRHLGAVAATVGARRPFIEDVDRLRVLAGDGWRSSFANFYPMFQPIEVFDSVWPMAALPAAEAEWRTNDLSICLGPLKQGRTPSATRYPDDNYLEGRKKFAELVEKAKTNRFMWNGPTFEFDSLSVDSGGEHRIACRLGRYFPMSISCDGLEHELVKRLAGDPDSPAPLNDLPARRWAHDMAGQLGPFYDGKGRSAAVSVATTILMATKEGGWKVLLAPRSAEVAAHAYFNHVLPSGIFQPLDWDEVELQDEYSVERVMLREYSEELYNNESLDVGSGVLSDVYAESEVERLLQEREDGALEIYYTGISLNLLTLRHEICTMILVNDHEWLRREYRRAHKARRMIYGWEVLDKREGVAVERYGRSLHLDTDFSPVNDPMRAAVLPGALIGNAAASMYLAFRVAKEVSASW
jgi:hypothetical protein